MEREKAPSAEEKDQKLQNSDEINVVVTDFCQKFPKIIFESQVKYIF